MHLFNGWSRRQLAHASESIPLAIQFVGSDKADKEPILAVAEQVAFIGAAKAQRQGVEQANAGNFAGAEQILRAAEANLVSNASRGSALCSDTLGAYRSVMEAMNAQNYSQQIGTYGSNSAYQASR